MTSRRQILAAARQLIDAHGWEKLSIRRLAAEMGIAPTTLYHHVKDKEDLLLLLLHEYADQMPRPELPSEPRNRIIAAAIAIHDALKDWTWAAEILTTDGFLARLSDSARWLVEAIVAGAIDSGCSPSRAVYVFRSIWYYTVGEILVRAHSAGKQSFGNDSVPDGLSVSQLPRLAAIGDQWAPLAAQDTYAEGLRAFVDGLLAQVTTT
ncbi:TetR/AcrR family transcriptional regulator [Micromonospora sp. HM5-17]|nr:TetR/AcrR family transcriptional regulator [Micromonospora sp. HM5-17]